MLHGRYRRYQTQSNGDMGMKDIIECMEMFIDDPGPCLVLIGAILFGMVIVGGM